MKKSIFSLMALFLCFTTALAWADKPKPMEHVVYVDVPEHWNIHKELEVVNASPFWINKVVVAEVDPQGVLTPVCTLEHIRPGGDDDYETPGRRGLSSLRGKRLAIKVKAVKATSSQLYVPMKEYKKNDALVTYSYEASLSYRHHHLYITLKYVEKDGKNNTSIMDF